MWRYYIPAILVLVLAGFLLRGLFMDARVVPTALMDRDIPAFALPELFDGNATVSENSHQKGQIMMVNFWASWCAPCRVEHPQLLALRDSGRVQMLGVAYRNEPAQARAFLENLGNPFDAVAVDEDGRTGFDWGVAGVPETFVINRDGRVVYRHQGPIHGRDLEDVFWPLLDELTP